MVQVIHPDDRIAYADLSITERASLARPMRRYCGTTLAAARWQDLTAVSEYADLGLALARIVREHYEQMTDAATRLQDAESAVIAAGIAYAEAWANKRRGLE